MKVLFITHPRISHIKPILGLIYSIQSFGRDIEVYVITSAEYKYLFNENVIVKPVVYEEKPFQNVVQKESVDIIKMDEKEKNSYFFEQMEKNFENFIFETPNVRNTILDLISEIEPEIILRDSIETVGLEFCYHNEGVKLVTYVTNNIYTFDYLCEDTNRFKLYFGMKEIPTLLIRLILPEIRNYLESAFSSFQSKYKYPFLYFFYNRNPKEELIINFSTSCFYPQNFLKEGVVTCLPHNDYVDYSLEEDEKIFVQSNQGKKIVYICCGSYIQLPKKYFEDYIDIFLKFGFILVVSTNYYSNDDFTYDKNKVLIKKRVNQNFILRNSYIVVSSGGHNTILEAIKHAVPILVDPQVNEQILNGLLIEENLYGLTFESSRDTELDKLTIISLLISHYSLFKDRIVKGQFKLLSELEELEEKNKYIVQKILKGRI
ncbi:hypothetical protein [Streptococcus ruminantium]|uniref:hypothetical protein n=1 Tax=Streptococcus ruminantium TaxID=1917441 RepID=UPI0012DD2338|nr:hypothetical protein [Streptococcus ruminantium]